jgi:5'-nucleotidase
MLILCTNDDGYLARGLKVLSDAAQALGEVYVVAPDREQSATSHSLTMHVPIRALDVSERTWSVTGTPTDCVFLAVQELLPRRPDFVLSGVNHGMNMGEDVLYSGTVSAAMEATVFGVPAVAISYTGREPEHLEAYGALLARLLPQLVRPGAFPRETLLNVNLPAMHPSEVKGVQVTRLGRRVFSDSVARRVDPRGRPYYWLGVGKAEWAWNEGTDFAAVDDGYISVTPLHIDFTNHDLIAHVASWQLTI